MDFKRRSFSKVRVYQLVCRFRELAARNIVNKPPALLSWSETAKRQYQSFSHQAKAYSAAPQPQRNPDEWHFVALDEAKKFEKALENSDKTWQHRAFEILEVLNKPEAIRKPKMAADWLICAQIVVSHNHFLKNQQPINVRGSETWQRAVWRSERLNHPAKNQEDATWKNVYRLISKYEFRSRKTGWEKIASRTMEHLTIQKN